MQAVTPRRCPLLCTVLYSICANLCLSAAFSLKLKPRAP
jgi:hypothetical protein